MQQEHKTPAAFAFFMGCLLYVFYHLQIDFISFLPANH